MSDDLQIFYGDNLNYQNHVDAFKTKEWMAAYNKPLTTVLFMPFNKLTIDMARNGCAIINEISPNKYEGIVNSKFFQLVNS